MEINERIDKPKRLSSLLCIIPERVPDFVAAPCRPPAGYDRRVFLCLNTAAYDR